MDERKCPRCKSDVMLVDPTEHEWAIEVEEWEEDEEFWLCSECDWHEVADPEDALDYHSANIEWVMARIASNQERNPE